MNYNLLHMKKTFLILSSLLVLASCGSDDNGAADPTGPTQPGGIDGALSPEEGKQQLETNAINVLNKVEAFNNDSALEKIIELGEFLQPKKTNTPPTTSPKQLNNPGTIAINSITNVSLSKKELVKANTAQLQIVQKTTLDRFNEDKGIYTWNTTTEEFDKTAESDDQIYNIAYNGKNAIFSITDFNSVQAANDTEAPTLAKANLKIDGVTVFSQEYTASIDAGKTVPNSVNNITTIGEFSMNTTYTNENNAKITQSFDFKLGNDVITGYSYTANGDFNTAENQDATIFDVLDSAKVSLNFLNASLVVSANDSDLPNTENLTIDQQIDLLNSKITSELIINNKSVAKGQFYKDQEVIFLPGITSPALPGQDPIIVPDETITNDIINARFLFEDGTTSDFETYFDNSFTQTENKFESVINVYTKLFENIDFGSNTEDTIVTPDPIVEVPKTEQP